MTAPLDGIAPYSTFVYGLAERHPFVTHSTLTLAPIGATLAKLEGRIECQSGIHLEVWELVDFATHRIRSYSYEVYLGGEKVCWYDAWEHPEIPALASTFPHHKHVPPDLRDNRVPAPGIGFESPNLQVVLEDVRRDWFPMLDLEVSKSRSKTSQEVLSQEPSRESLRKASPKDREID